MAWKGVRGLTLEDLPRRKEKSLWLLGFTGAEVGVGFIVNLCKVLLPCWIYGLGRVVSSLKDAYESA